jgi:aminoglycoside 6'-N-acetyltransferase
MPLPSVADTLPVAESRGVAAGEDDTVAEGTHLTVTINDDHVMTAGSARHLGPDTAFDRLTTRRLIVRRFTASDAPSFAAYRSDPQVARYQSWTSPYSQQQADRFIDALGAGHPDTPGAWFQFAVEEAASGHHVGDVAAHVDEGEPRLATIGVTFAQDHWGRGFALEALTALCDYLFVERRKHRIAADCDACNTASAGLLERLGMRREAHHLANTWEDGEWTDEYCYAVLADEWEARRPTARG